MSEDTINRISDRIQRAQALNNEDRKELLALLNHLREEMQEEQHFAHLEKIEHVLGVSELSSQETPSKSEEPDPLAKGVDALKSSVLELESSHPKASQALARFTQILSNMGI
ncbi:MAG: hypothetical protein AAGD22_15300 [Verrucomicrobiota bacterium]